MMSETQESGGLFSNGSEDAFEELDRELTRFKQRREEQVRKQQREQRREDIIALARRLYIAHATTAGTMECLEHAAGFYKNADAFFAGEDTGQFDGKE